jgi:MFS family permease
LTAARSGHAGRAPLAARRLRVSAITIGLALGVYLPFIAVALTERGLTVTQVGLVMSLGAVGFVVAVPVWGHAADVIFGRSWRACHRW